MKKTFIMVAVAFTLAAYGGSNANAQAVSQTLVSHYQFGAHKTVDLREARFVSLTPGNNFVTDKIGNNIFGVFVTTPQSFQTQGDFVGTYAPVEPGSALYVNVTQASFDCVGGNTVISWTAGGQQTIAGCWLADSIVARSKR